MAMMVERGEKPEFNVSTTPKTIELPKHLTDDGLKVVDEGAYKANNQDGSQQQVQPSGGGTVVSPPADKKTLISWAKGPIESALTWLGAFWLRMIKKGSSHVS